MAAWSSSRMVLQGEQQQSSSKSYQWWGWRKRFPNLPSFRWKGLDLQGRIVEKLVFKLLYILEAVVVVSTLCFFFLCCGCHI
uniref:Uncharacterized protein n=1 Tax=Kalanchoe fedtschenkoi TaxID=63787 RepID=A0A7N0T356_KALFE